MAKRGTVEDELIRKLDLLIVLTAAKIGDNLSVAERVPLLHSLGLDRDQIARACGTKPKVVSVRLSEYRRRKREGRNRVDRDSG